MICPKLWKNYIQCWDDTINTISSDVLQESIEDGTIQLACRSERIMIEHYVGSIVSNAVSVGDHHDTQSSVSSSS
jgi:hypothetical protein